MAHPSLFKNLTAYIKPSYCAAMLRQLYGFIPTPSARSTYKTRRLLAQTPYINYNR